MVGSNHSTGWGIMVDGIFVNTYKVYKLEYQIHEWRCHVHQQNSLQNWNLLNVLEIKNI